MIEASSSSEETPLGREKNGITNATFSKFSFLVPLPLSNKRLGKTGELCRGSDVFSGVGKRRWARGSSLEESELAGCMRSLRLMVEFQ